MRLIYYHLLLCFVFLFYVNNIWSQSEIKERNHIPPELLMQVKNIDEFIDLFNADSSYFAENISEGIEYSISRHDIIENLFDLSDPRLDSGNSNFKTYNQLKKVFVSHITAKEIEIRKDTNLWAFINCNFLYHSHEIPVLLLLKYTYDGDDDWRWTISKVNSEAFDISHKTIISEYIPPHSDNLDFFNLNKFINVDINTSNLTSPNFQYNELSVFLFLIESGQLIFKQSKQMVYVYYGISEWTLHLNEYNRPGYNTGWLISDIKQVE